MARKSNEVLHRGAIASVEPRSGCTLGKATAQFCNSPAALILTQRFDVAHSRWLQPAAGREIPDLAAGLDPAHERQMSVGDTKAVSANSGNTEIQIVIGGKICVALLINWGSYVTKCANATYNL